MPAGTSYTARFELPELVEQGVDNRLICRVYRAGALVEPTSGTVSLWDASGNAVLDAVAIDSPVAGSVAAHTVLAAVTSPLTLGEGWLIEWALAMPDGFTHKFRNEAALVRRRLYPVVTEADIYRRCKSLDPSGPAPITSETNFADKIDEAFVEMQNAIIAGGNRPNLIISPSSLREAHLLLTIAFIFEDLASRLNAAYAEEGKRWRGLASNAFAKVRMLYAKDDTAAAPNRTRRPAKPVLFLTSRANRDPGRTPGGAGWPFQ